MIDRLDARSPAEVHLFTPVMMMGMTS